jgi:hypothetical protein
MCIKLEINQDYTTMHGLPIIKKIKLLNETQIDKTVLQNVLHIIQKKFMYVGKFVIKIYITCIIWKQNSIITLISWIRAL